MLITKHEQGRGLCPTSKGTKSREPVSIRGDALHPGQPSARRQHGPSDVQPCSFCYHHTRRPSRGSPVQEQLAEVTRQKGQFPQPRACSVPPSRLPYPRSDLPPLSQSASTRGSRSHHACQQQRQESRRGLQGSWYEDAAESRSTVQAAGCWCPQTPSQAVWPCPSELGGVFGFLLSLWAFLICMQSLLRCKPGALLVPPPDFQQGREAGWMRLRQRWPRARCSEESQSRRYATQPPPSSSLHKGIAPKQLIYSSPL